jgi:hypothetical protein
MEKPPLLYHGSSKRGLVLLEPRAIGVRDSAEGPVVFACRDLALATVFMVRMGDRWTQIGTFGGAYHMVISDRARFEQSDRGGSVYVVPSDSFSCDLEKGMRELEWISREPVKPIDVYDYPCALEAMIQHGVQVFFVKPETFQSIQMADDHGLAILQSLTSENQLRGINVLPLASADAPQS